MISIRVALVLCLAAVTMAQIPSFGWCPEYAPMADFDMNKYLGVWYESEKYFTMLEVGSRCVTTNYTHGQDGKFHVSNQITNRITGIKRILDGELRSVGKAGEGKLTVKYTTLPVSFDTTFHVLDTDYKNYAVLWSCSNLGPVKTQNAWVMTRERLAPGNVLQQAYGVLDKFKISRTFFVKTDQGDCAILEASDAPVVAHSEEGDYTEEEGAVRHAPPLAVDPVVAPVEQVAAKPVHVAQVVDPTLHVKHDEVVAAVDEPSGAMLPPAPVVEIAEPIIPVEAVKAEEVVVVEEIAVPALAVEAIVPAEEAAPVEAVVDAVKTEEAAPVVDAVKAEEAAPVVDAIMTEEAAPVVAAAVEAAPLAPVEAVEPLVPQIPAKVLAAKSQIKKKTHA